MTTRQRRGRQRGQALAEMGLVILLFVTLTLGIIDFGRMLMVLNVVTHAARDGARAAALIPPAAWATESGTIPANVEAQIATVTTTDFTVNAPVCTLVNGRPSVSVTVAGDEPYLFNFIWGGSVTVNRVATYRYEMLQTACP